MLGVETSTLDASGEVTARHDMGGVTLDAVRAAVAEHLTGTDRPGAADGVGPAGRRPPPARAGPGGRRGRAGGPAGDRPPVRRATRRRTRSSTGSRSQCSSGTYIRTLAADLGHLLGGGAHLRDLRRTAIGSFTEAEAAPPDTAELLPPAEALRDYERIVVDEDTAALIRHGRRLPAFAGAGRRGRCSAADGALLAVYDAHPDGAAPAVVLAGA